MNAKNVFYLVLLVPVIQQHAQAVQMVIILQVAHVINATINANRATVL